MCWRPGRKVGTAGNLPVRRAVLGFVAAGIWSIRRVTGNAAWLVALAVLAAGCGPGSGPAAGRQDASPGPARTPGAGAARYGVALKDLRMFNPRAGWAVTVNRDGVPVNVVRTADGGRTWRAAGPPGLHGQQLRASFLSARDAWVTWSFPGRRAWPVTYRTANSGRTWERLGRVRIAAIGASPPDMVTARTGWVTASLGAAAGSSGIAIFRTADGGARWRLAELTTGGGQGRPTPGAIPFGCAKSFAVFSTVRTGWVGGSCGGGRPALWVSRDSGRTWRYQPLPRPSGVGRLAGFAGAIGPPTFITPDDGALWATGMPGPPGRSDAAYLTTDGGRRWIPVKLSGGLVPLATPDFADPWHGFVLAGRLSPDGTAPGQARLYATSDGGATWTVRSAAPLPGQAVLDFVTPAAGFATVISDPPYQAYLLATGNGGRTWTATTPRLTARASPGAPIPWTDHTAPVYTPPPQPTPTAPSAEYAACTASDLTGKPGDVSVGAGQVTQYIVLTNAGSGACTLSGAPSTLTGVRADGSQTTLASGSANTNQEFDLIGPANLQPGQSAQVAISTTDMCSAAVTGGTDDYTAVMLGIGPSGDVEVSLSSGHPLNVICGAAGVRAYGTPQTATDQISSPLNGLTATAAMPAMLIAGTTAIYTVTLQNTKDQPVALSPCPSYSEFISPLGTRPGSSSLQYFLDCQATSEIPADGSVTFDMHIPVPAAPGWAKYGWTLQGTSVSTGGAVTITGTTVNP